MHTSQARTDNWSQHVGHKTERGFEGKRRGSTAPDKSCCYFGHSIEGDEILLLGLCFCVTFNIFEAAFPIKALLAVKAFLSTPPPSPLLALPVTAQLI